MTTSSLRNVIETRFLPFVQKPMQYVGNEINMVRKDLSGPGVRLHGVLCFPETYDIGMSHYGGQILYHIVNSHPSWALSRCYHPQPDGLARMRETGLPLFCLEYLAPVSEADWIGFSVTYELQFTNIVSMLSLAKIPILASERGEATPIVIAGGCAVSNPEPIADFIDAFVIGDGEAAVVEICEILQRMKSAQAPRRETLEALSACAGVYVPALYAPDRIGRFVVSNGGAPAVSAAKVAELKDDYYPSKPLVPLVNVVHHRLAVEVMRGCTRGCRFCAAGMTYRPVRERAVSGLIDQMTDGIAATGWRDVGLLSLSTADYSGLSSLLAGSRNLTRDRRIRLSLPSTRIDSMSDEDLDALGQITPFSSFTIAPEAGTQRLRDVINKGFTENDIFAMVRRLLNRNIQTIKLYFMIGLPTEREEDIDGIISCVRSISDTAWSASRRVAINVAISPFSPKPHTPFQWEAVDAADVLMRKSHRIKKALQQNRNVKVSYRNPQMSILETVMARGDRSLSACIIKAWENGALFDGRDENFSFERWKSAFASCGAADMQTLCDAIPLDQPLPWSVVSLGVTREFLLTEREKAYAQASSPDCRDGSCSSCGVCKDGIRIGVQKSLEEPCAPNAPGAPATPKSGAKQHYRFVYEKGLSVRFLGHLDMMNVLQRAFLAARLPIAYSEGFHSHPIIAYGPPLSLSIAADNELLDMTTTAPLSPDCALINRYLPEGLRIKRIFASPLHHASLNEDICAGRYSFSMSDPSCIGTDAATVRTKTSEFLAQKECTVSIQKGDEKRIKNIRPLVHSLTPFDGHNPAGFEAVLSMEPKNTCRPSDLLAALFPLTHPSAWIVRRLECLHRTGGTGALSAVTAG